MDTDSASARVLTMHRESLTRCERRGSAGPINGPTSSHPLVVDDIYSEHGGEAVPQEEKNDYDAVTSLSLKDKINLLHIGLCTFFPEATVSAFQGLTPVLLTILIEDQQHAGTLSSCTAGLGAFIALFATPIMTQLMDMYGRRVFAIVSSLKSVAIATPMVAAGIIAYQNDGGKYGEKLTGGALSSFKACVVVWFIAVFFKSATFSSQGVVVIGDLFRSAHHRSIGIGVYQASRTAAVMASLIGSHLPLMTACIAILTLAVVGVIYNFLFFPDTMHLLKKAEIAEDRASMVRREEGASGTTQVDAAPTPRQIDFFVSPIRGLRAIVHDRPALVALVIMYCFVFSEIMAGDVMGFYLAKKLKFRPTDLSSVAIEMTSIQVFTSIALVPFAGRFFACHTLATASSIMIAASLVLIAIAEAKFVVFIAMAPCALAIIALPSLVAVVTRKAVSPEQVAQVMNSVMALNFALSGAGGVIGGVLFALLTTPLLFLTFIFAASVTIPMFGLSIYLRVLLRREAKRDMHHV